MRSKKKTMLALFVLLAVASAVFADDLVMFNYQGAGARAGTGV